MKMPNPIVVTVEPEFHEMMRDMGRRLRLSTKLRIACLVADGLVLAAIAAVVLLEVLR